MTDGMDFSFFLDFSLATLGMVGSIHSLKAGLGETLVLRVIMINWVPSGTFTS